MMGKRIYGFVVVALYVLLLYKCAHAQPVNQPNLDRVCNVGCTTDNQIASTLATGTSPLSIASTTLNTNLNADLLDGQHGSYYAAADSYLKLDQTTPQTITAGLPYFVRGVKLGSNNANYGINFDDVTTLYWNYTPDEGGYLQFYLNGSGAAYNEFHSDMTWFLYTVTADVLNSAALTLDEPAGVLIMATDSGYVHSSSDIVVDTIETGAVKTTNIIQPDPVTLETEYLTNYSFAGSSDPWVLGSGWLWSGGRVTTSSASGTLSQTGLLISASTDDPKVLYCEVIGAATGCINRGGYPDLACYFHVQLYNDGVLIKQQLVGLPNNGSDDSDNFSVPITTDIDEIRIIKLGTTGTISLASVSLKTVDTTQSDLYASGNLNVLGNIYAYNLPSGGSMLKTNATTFEVENAVAGTDYEYPLTFSYPLTRATNTIGFGYNSTNLKLTANELNTIQDIATSASPTFDDLTLTNMAYTDETGGYVITNSVPTVANATGKAQFVSNYIPTTGNPANTINNLFNATTNLTALTPSVSTSHYGNKFIAAYEAFDNNSGFINTNYTGTYFSTTINGNYTSGMRMATASLTAVQNDVVFTGNHGGFGINFFPIVDNITFSSYTAASHQIIGRNQTLTFSPSSADNVNQLWGFQSAVTMSGTGVVAGGTFAFAGNILAAGTDSIRNDAAVYKAWAASSSATWDTALLAAKNLYMFWGQPGNGAAFAMTNQDTYVFFADISNNTRNFSFVSNGADGLMLSDSAAWKFGAGKDASITFDGNSLNIVANLITSTDDMELTAETYTFKTNADTDLAITLFGTSNSGLVTWMEDEDYLKFSDNSLINADQKIYFRDTAIYAYSSGDGWLNLVADTGVEVNAPVLNAVDIYAADDLDVDGDATLAGTANVLVIPTADPHVAGALWNNAGTLTVSAG